MERKIRVGIIGAGKMGKVYARWFSENPHCQVTAMYNRTRQRAEELAAEYAGARVYDTWESLVSDPAVDIVGICTPSHEHLEQMRLAVSLGKHVLCEKPMARDAGECREIVEFCRGAKSKIMVGFQMRFHPVVRTVDALLPRIGKIYHMDFVFGMYRPGDNWRNSLAQGGGVLKELSSHLFDLMSHWVGPVSSITGVNKIIDPNREIEDYSVNLLEFANGASGYLFSSYWERRSPAIHGNIMGTEGQVAFQFSSYDPAHSQVALYVGDGKQEIPIEIPGEIDRIYPGHLDSFQKEINHFVECILNDEQPLVSVVEGSAAIEIIDASYESTRIGTKVGLPLIGFDEGRLTQCFKRFQQGE